MSEKEFTAEEYRTAARIARGSNNNVAQSLGQHWEQKAIQLDAERLAWLEEHGLIVPEGGMALDAELTEDVKTFMIWAAGRNNGVPWPSESVRRLHDAFKPFERKTDVVDAQIEDEPESWPRWQDVPPRLRFTAANGQTQQLTRHGSSVYAHDITAWIDTSLLNDSAPFVRAEVES